MTLTLSNKQARKILKKIEPQLEFVLSDVQLDTHNKSQAVKNQVTHHYKPVKKTHCGLDITKKARKVSSFWESVTCKQCLRHLENIRAKVGEEGQRWGL